MIEGVKFLDEISEVEWYKVEGKNLIIGWKGIPKFFSTSQPQSSNAGKSCYQPRNSRLGSASYSEKLAGGKRKVLYLFCFS